MDHYQEVIMVALSESVMKNRLKRPLAEKSRWLHIRLAIKSRYPGMLTIPGPTRPRPRHNPPRPRPRHETLETETETETRDRDRDRDRDTRPWLTLGDRRRQGSLEVSVSDRFRDWRGNVSHTSTLTSLATIESTSSWVNYSISAIAKSSVAIASLYF